METNDNKKESPLRLLPRVDALLKSATGQEITRELSSNQTTELARAAVEQLRAELRENATDEVVTRDVLQQKAESRLRELFATTKRQKFQRVINATGVIIHTNLGRAPLSENAKKAILETAAGYCTLEYDLETGKRGRRGRQVEELLCEITNAEAALVVNNCAAATILVLTALAAGGESIVSRGELVEIGGDFRVPDVMAQSGTKLVEVGTTNRTKLRDFAGAITENTKLFVRVHPSNFRIVGFTEMPDLKELADLAHEQNVLLYEDAGSGALFDLSQFGLTNEPVIVNSIKAGADVVSFSGDKLLGGVQSGLIVGKSWVIEKLRKHPLYRALRVDKTAFAALTATLELYQQKCFSQIPVLQMLMQTKTEIEQRAVNLVKRFQDSNYKLQIQDENEKPQNLNLQLVTGFSAVGGGAAPLAQLETVLIALQHKNLTAEQLEQRLRFSVPPIVARTAENQVLLDLRTVTTLEEDEILSVLLEIDSNI